MPDAGEAVPAVGVHAVEVARRLAAKEIAHLLRLEEPVGALEGAAGLDVRGRLGERLHGERGVPRARPRTGDAQAVLDSIKSELTPAGQIEFLQARADILAAQRRWPDARRELERLLQLAPLNGKALLSVGRTYAAEEDVPRATLAFEAASRAEGTAYVADLELANIELKNRNFVKSAEYLEKALGIQKTDAVEDYLARVKTLSAKEDQQQQ